jgi:hypothetical protein
MTLCPIAIAVTCKKCPIFGICPAKGIIGDYKPDAPVEKNVAKGPAKGTTTAKKTAAKSKRGARTAK